MRLPSVNARLLLQLSLGGAALVALGLLALRSGDDRGIEVVAREPRAGIDEIRVDVGGAVREPRVVTVQPGDRIADAIALAGGLAPDADTQAVNLSRRVVDEDVVRVPRVGESAALIDVNAASRSELDALPGIGEVYSAAIVDAREREGPYTTTDDLVARGVIPEGVYEQIRDRIAAR